MALSIGLIIVGAFMGASPVNLVVMAVVLAVVDATIDAYRR